MNRNNSWRMDVSLEYLRDAKRGELSPASRLTCAWEAIYFCCCEVAARRGRVLDELEHPDASVVEHLLRALAASPDERRQVESLLRWSSHLWPLLPEPCSPEDACNLADSLHARTVALISSE